MSEVFDRFAKWTARGSSRRDVLRYLGGFLGGGFLMGGLSGCKQLKTISAECQTFCAACNGVNGAYGNCLSVCEACALTGGSLCPGPISTALSSCTSSTVVTCCYGAATCCTSITGAPYCTNTNFDVNNCGGCVPGSSSGVVCKKGTTPGCCGGQCTDLSSDVTHCGRCRRACTGTRPNCCSGKCTNTQTDVNNCGNCGMACSSVTPARTAPGCCSGACVDFSVNGNCGGCGVTCSGSTPNCTGTTVGSVTTYSCTM